MDLNRTEIALRLAQLTTLTVELGNMNNIPFVLEKILEVAKNITYADGGTLYKVSPDKKNLCFYILMNDTLGIYQGGSSGNPVNIPDIPLYNENGEPNLSAVAAYTAHTGQSVNIPNVYESEEFNFSGMRRFDEQHYYYSRSFLAVPMRDHEGELIGVLQLINAQDPMTGMAHEFSVTDQRFIEALAAQAAMAITRQELILRLENLFEAFINLINIGIDEKSPNTGRHCEHVPVLTMMLAEATHNTHDGPLANFFMNDRDRKELWIAGLLHDCGKIAMPVHVVEKATKLQTICDRIHHVDARFEVLKRDAEIRVLKKKYEMAIAGIPLDHQAIEHALNQEISRLDEDRDFLRHINFGVERMREEDQNRVREIARYRWRAPDGHERDLLDEEEVKNLIIRAGTLNDEERQIINNHINITIKMLESLPWPKHLQHVPEYACGHHEKMDGTGYPRGLRGEQMSVQARMMAIADIFEALTARDRPYKSGKTLSEALGILASFRDNNHIDPELFDVFIRQKVYLQYAERFLEPAQIDEVDESLLLKELA